MATDNTLKLNLSMQQVEEDKELSDTKLTIEYPTLGRTSKEG